MTKPESKLEDLLRTIVAAICRKTPEPKKLQWFEQEAMFVFNIVSGSDHGRLVGKKGITFWAVSTLMWYAGQAQIMRPASIRLLDPEMPNGHRQSVPFRPNEKWDRGAIRTLVDKILQICFNEVTGAFVIEDNKDGTGIVHVSLEKYLQMQCGDPSFEEALQVVVHSAGMAGGASLKTEITWK